MSKAVENFSEAIIANIANKERNEWNKETREVSEKIRDGVVEYIESEFLKGKEKNKDLRFLDYCNAIKSLIAVYDFGMLVSERDLFEASQKDAKAAKARFEKDREIMFQGIRDIINHVHKYGYDIAPYLSFEEALEAIDHNSSDGKLYITFTATTVLTTFVYFRRAFSRDNVFPKKDYDVFFNDEYNVTHEITDILDLLYKYAASSTEYKTPFTGWGFTLKPEISRSVTLNDTYAAVDAISKFYDGFLRGENENGDEELVKAINKYYSISRNKPDNNYFVSQSNDSIYKTSINVYKRVKGVFGRGIFYEDVTYDRLAEKRLNYNYKLTTYDQIASSSRSSALFNPLYVSMITLCGYCEKELVIAKFMDDHKLLRKYYHNEELYKDIEKYAGSLYPEIYGERDEYDMDIKNDRHRSFREDIEDILNYKDGNLSTAYHNEKMRAKSYQVGRVFQKYLEKKLPKELSKIDEYRDYLNETKDALDQVQLMYRDFTNSQRLGVVDTDYVMFNDTDLESEKDGLNISKLNKINYAVNNIRPLLLSSKIMIVRALVNYPQKDINDVYTSIKESVYGGVNSTSWLWNYNAIDMNSTSRHCESIMYDYFDYYNDFEIGLQALTRLNKDSKSIIDANGKITAGNGEPFKDLIIGLVNKNLDSIKRYYDKVRSDDSEAHLKQINELQEKINDIQAQYDKKVKELEGVKNGTTYLMGEKMQQWMYESFLDNFSKMMSMTVLKKLNVGSSEYLDAENLAEKSESFVHGTNPVVKNLRDEIIDKYSEQDPNFKKLYDEYWDKVKDIVKAAEVALDPVTILLNESGVITDNPSLSLEKKNEELFHKYDDMHKKVIKDK